LVAEWRSLSAAGGIGRWAPWREQRLSDLFRRPVLTPVRASAGESCAAVPSVSRGRGPRPVSRCPPSLSKLARSGRRGASARVASAQQCVSSAMPSTLLVGALLQLNRAEAPCVMITVFRRSKRKRARLSRSSGGGHRGAPSLCVLVGVGTPVSLCTHMVGTPPLHVHGGDPQSATSSCVLAGVGTPVSVRIVGVSRALLAFVLVPACCSL
jgi:hypothetical protein